MSQTKIRELRARAAIDLRAARGSDDSILNSIISYLREGYRLGLSEAELTDFFCVSTPNILEQAGYTDTEGDTVAALFDELHDKFRRTDG